MVKKLAVFLFLFLPVFAFAQTSSQIEANKGVLKLAPTAQLPAPTCRLGQLWFDTTTATVKVCDDGVNWVAIGGGVPSATIENGVTQTLGCIAGGVLRSISNLVDCSAGFTYASGVAGVGTASTTSGALRIFNSAHAFYTELTVSGTQGANVSYTFPDDDGSNGQVLSTNGSGVLDWIDAAGGGAAAVCTSAVGTDAYACPALTTGTCPASFAAAASVPVWMTTDVANTGASTFDLCSLGAKAIVRGAPTASTATVTGDMVAAYSYLLQYNATGDNFKLESIPASVGLINQVNTWAAGQTMSQNITLANSSRLLVGTTSGSASIENLIALTPDAPLMQVGSVSRSWHFSEDADRGYDFNNGPCGTSACTDPTLIIHSETQDTTQYNAAAVWGQAGGAIKALTAGAATAVVRIPVPTNSRSAGELVYEIYATDGTDMQVRTSRIRYAMTNKAGTEACTITAMDGAAASDQTNDDNASSISAGTLTYGIACTNNAADTMDITFNAVSSLAETTLQATWSVVHLSPGNPVRQ